MLHLSLNLNNFSETLAVLNLGGSFVRTIEFEQQCEVYYAVSYEILWPLRSVARMLITQTYYAGIILISSRACNFDKPVHAQGY